jgi:undecaprenyl-diphosphatase
MVTILAALLLGFTPAAAAEYSFLLALPTLGAAVGFDLAKSGSLLFQQVGLSSFLIGFFTSAIVAAIAIKFFISYLNRHGLSLFGWYRIVLAVIVWRCLN